MNRSKTYLINYKVLDALHLKLVICFVFLFSSGRAQEKIPLSGSYGVITNHLDLYGEWIFFPSDTTCVHVYGSLVFESFTDTLRCAINDRQISIFGAKKGTLLSESPVLEIELINRKKYPKKLKDHRFEKSHFLPSLFVYNPKQTEIVELTDSIVALKMIGVR